MNEFPGTDRPEHLARVADRIASAGYDPSKTLRRLHWLERWPLLALAATAVVVTALLLDGRWSVALMIALLVVPDRVYAWRTRTAEREALVLDGDFFERERANLERRLLGEEVHAGAGLAIALFLVSIAAFRPEPAPRLWVLAAVIAVVAVVRLAVLAPALSRELRDLGGESTGVRAAVVMVAFIMLLPALLPGWLLYRGARRLIGRPVKDDEDDE
jgi:hypothetical protein